MIFGNFANIGNSACQLSGMDEKNNNFLSVNVKKSYLILQDGNCVISEAQLPLNMDFIFNKSDEELLDTDTDVYCNKPQTDIVIKGSANISEKIGKSQVTVEVSGHQKKLRLIIIGNRIAYKNHYGNIVFTEPDQIIKQPLEYFYAYGGIDKIAEQKFELPDKAIMDSIPEIDWMATSPYRYPRNPCGKGYLIEDHSNSFEHFELPNIEDPMCMLTPSNLLLQKPENWVYQPLPRSTTWVNPTWFPRIVYFGVLPEFEKSAKPRDFQEIEQNLLNPNILDECSMEDMVSNKAANGASLGLQFPYLKGNEKIKLTNIHPTKQDFVLQLPGDRPKIWVDGRNGTLKPTTPVIHTIVIEPDEGRLSIVWRGSAPALRPYMDEELKTMPFKVEW